MRIAIVACLVTLGLTSARADTTYYYTGHPYTVFDGTPSTGAYTPAQFGTNMTGSITFDFDTAGVSGTYYANFAYDPAQPGRSDITSISVASGIFSMQGLGFGIIAIFQDSTFVLTDGAISDWSIQTVPGPSFMSGPDGDKLAQQCLVCFNNGGSPATAFASGPGVWSLTNPAAVPGPVFGAGLPGLLLALFGWWLIARYSLAFRLAD